MAREMFQIYTVQTTGKCICENFPPSLHDLIITADVEQPLYLCETVPLSLHNLIIISHVK